MFYHVLIETSEKVGKNGAYKAHLELDKSELDEIENDVIIPYLKNEQFQFDGYFINAREVKRIVVKETNVTTQALSDYENNNIPSGLIMFISREDIFNDDKHTVDITKKVFSSAKEKLGHTSVIPKSQTLLESDKSKVFIVHGHDELAKTEAARFVEKMGFEPIILHEQASLGSTIIEKIEKYSNVGFGVVLYTPCDVGAKINDESNLKSRARQNVVFEHGFLIGKLGRKNICALVKGNVETPNDISGVVYVPMDEHGAWKLSLAKEMRSSGYDVDMNKII
ncbi:TIR domain-containing protein [Aeromonas veronii]